MAEPEDMTTILLVEDDPLQAFVRKSALEKKFHDVQRAADPIEAFCMVEQPQFAGKLGLVIADLHMPGLAAPEFVAELHARLPGVPVLVLGDAKGATTEYPADRVRFLAQPIASDEMLTAASQLIAHDKAVRQAH
jgi:DNA-binding NtrC family response regulator